MMETVLTWLETNKLVVGIFGSLLFGAAMYWATKRFIPRSEFNQYKQTTDSSLQKLSDKVNTIESDINGINLSVKGIETHIKTLPTVDEISGLREKIAHLNGLLEGTQPLLKTLLNNDSMLIQNEIGKGDK